MKNVNNTSPEYRELLIDLCSRLPYETYVSIILPPNLRGIHWKLEDDLKVNTQLTFDVLKHNEVKYLRPYLRPILSLTDEEFLEYQTARNASYKDEMDWLNANHIDYRELIKLGQAIEVTEENNPYKN